MHQRTGQVLTFWNTAKMQQITEEGSGKENR